MSNSNFKMADRILSILLAFIMIVSLMPMTVFASTEANPGKFTVTVKNESDEPITDAGIFYEIFVDSESKVSGNLSTTNGEAVIPNVSDYSDDIADESKTVEISYQITKDGYTTVNNKVTVTDAKGNIDVTMFAVAPETTNVSVVKNGDGKVEINNEEITSSAVDKGSEVTFRFTPDEGSYIKEVKIGDVSEEITDSNLFEKTITVDEDISVSVTFVKTFTVVVTKNDGGTVKLNNEAVTSRAYDENDTAEINVIPEEGYQINSVKIGDIEQTIDDVNNFSTSFSVTEDVNVDVSFVKVYVITVLYDGEGTVETSPECVGGSVTVKTGAIVSVKATPSENYRVLNVVINDRVDIETTDNTYDNSHPYTKNLNANQNYTIKITFALKLCNINVNAPEHGSVSVESNSVDYGGNTTVTIIPDSGYVVNTVKVDDADLTDKLYTKDESALELKLENITKDKDIKVEFKLSEAATIDSIMWNDTEALRTNTDENLYVFAEGSSVTFSTTKEAIRINGESQEEWKSSEWSINENKIITKIELYYDLGWHEVKINGESVYYNIVFDADDPVPTISPSGANDYDYYNTDVKVELKAVDSSNYSGLNTVEYWVTCDETETERKTLYAYSDGDEIKSEFNDYITVYAEENNSDNVKVYLEVTDRAGNKNQTSTDLKINSTVPTLSVSIDGTLDSEATAGYYNSNRIATVKIVDRASCFDETLAEDGIDISAVDAKGNPIKITKASMIAWTHNGDTHTATITFSEEANYSWSVSYTSKSGLSNSGFVSETGDSIYNFAVDKTAPSGTISIDADNKWDTLLSSLTFGIWKNYSVTATADGSDDISPIYDIKYYKSNSDAALSENELIALYEAGKFTTEKYTVSADELFVVYARISDYAGNTLYIGSNGIIVDTTGSEKQITLTPDEPNANGYYNSDVNVAVEVDEEVVSGQAYSGIKTVDYVVEKDGVKTQEGNLFTFDISNPTQKQLVNEWKGSITVDPTINNSCDTVVYVKTVDNAGNESTESVALDIDVTAPTIRIAYDDTANVNAEEGYFTSRTATVVITERTHHFDADSATNGITINAVDANGKAIENAYTISDWTTAEGKTSDAATHTATIKFNKDANYIFAISYTDNADNNTTPDVTGQTVPYEFTVDTTKPTGSVTVEANTWDKLLEVLTFGLYKSSTAKVSATADDDTSPVVIEYYKTSNATVMTEKELDTVTDWTAFENSALEQNGVSPDEQFVVYLKITDYAGNYTYINSDGYIVEKSESKIELIPEKANENGVYGLAYEDGINVDVKITDSEPYSGIRTVDYWIEKDGAKTQEGNLFTFDISNPTQKQLVNEWKGSITVDPTINNSCDTVVYVKTVDNAGNESTESVALDIDVTAPTIRIAYDDTANVNAEEGYFTSRTATVVITERTHHFDADSATNGITINAVDANGKAIENAYTISDWTTAEGKTSDAATHTATIKFNKDANYTFVISYTDNADNKNTEPDVTGQTAPYEFTVDTTKPTGSVTAKSSEGRTETWSSLIDTLTFGFWSNKKISISGTSNDVISPIASVQYYMPVATNASDETSALDAKSLDNISSWKSFNGFDVTVNKQFTVYLKITDNAGNYTYVGTNGLIVDDQHPVVESVAPEITVTPEKPINGIYKDDVKVSIKVDDPMVSGTYSGLKEITYKVFDRASATPNTPTQEGTLYTFSNSNPKQSELLKTWTGNITVKSAKNNSNNIQIVVYAVDNAGNAGDNSQKGSSGYTVIKIDTTAPVIDISYNNNNADSNTYFKDNRVATIKITERNFNADDVKIKVTKSGSEVKNSLDWKDITGSYNLDNSTHTATITYGADGDYTFAIEYTDLAGNKCTSINFADGTVAESKFTIDKTLPTVEVSYDNNSAQNSNYYKESRSATIVITEHNFNPDR